jgi:hypothetical protein
MTPRETDATSRLEQALGRLPRNVDPAHDLWPAIEARLEAREARPRRWPWQAAAAVLLVAGSSLLTASLVRRDLSRVVRMQAPAAQVATIPAAYGAAYALDPEYVAARQQLSSMLESRIDSMPASARQKLEANLAEIRRATAEISEALALQPGDPLLEELLLNTYQDELAVLASVNQLTGTNGAAAPQADKGMRL